MLLICEQQTIGRYIISKLSTISKQQLFALSAQNAARRTKSTAYRLEFVEKRDHFQHDVGFNEVCVLGQEIECSQSCPAAPDCPHA